jgi:hypothetical protein
MGRSLHATLYGWLIRLSLIIFIHRSYLLFLPMRQRRLMGTEAEVSGGSMPDSGYTNTRRTRYTE